MKKKLLYTLLLIYIFPFLLIAQYKKGGIRLMNGETLYGYLAQDTEVELKRRVHFKKSLGKMAYEVYSPNEIAGFFFDKGPTFDAILTSFRRDNLELKQKAFAKLVARGTIDLYLFQENIEESKFIFYAEKDGQLHRLSEEEYILRADGLGYKRRSYYQGILKALTFDCRRRIGDIQNLPFSRKHIVETIHNYNACRDPDYEPLNNAYKVAREKRYFIEFFAGPLVGKRNFGSISGNDRLIRKEFFIVAGIAAQIETYKPSLSRNLLIHNSLEAYKWIAWEESGIIRPPALSLAYNMSAHYLFSETARVKFFTRIGGTFIMDIGENILPRPGISLGAGTYFPSGGRLDLQLSSFSFLTSDGITAWRIGYAIPLGSEWK